MTVEPAIPAVPEIVGQLEGALRGDWPAAPDRLGSLLLELHRSNLSQWDLEDTTRVPDAADSVVAGAKRAIDDLNLNRHGLIQQIDAAVLDGLTQSSTAALATETPGMVFDRLSVLIIRIARTAEMAGTDLDGGAGYAARLPILQGQLAGLTAALDGFLQELRDGLRRFVPYEQLKLYAPSRAAAGLSRSSGADTRRG